MDEKIKNMPPSKLGGYILIISLLIFGTGITFMPITSTFESKIKIIPMLGILIGAPFIILGLRFYQYYFSKFSEENALINSGIFLMSWGFTGIFIHWCLEASIITGAENIIHVSSIGYRELVSEISTPISLFSGAIVWIGFSITSITSAIILDMKIYEYWFFILSGIYSIFASIIHYIQIFFPLNQFLFSSLLTISLLSFILWCFLTGLKMIKES